MSRASFFSDFFLGSKNFSTSFTPSPFVDLAGSRAPTNLKRLFPLLEWYAKMDDTVAPVIQKASMYPVMPVDYSSIEDETVRKYNKSIFEDCLDVRNAMIKMNLDYYSYGNAFASVAFPFKRWFKCQKCNHKIYSENLSSFSFRSHRFYFKCPKCGDSTKPKDFGDQYIKDRKKIRIIQWRPHDMDIIFHPFSGQKKFVYTPDYDVKKQINSGSKFILDHTPKIFLEAMRMKEKIVFGEDKVFHMARPSMSSKEITFGWGIPLILPCILPGYLKKVFHKASEVAGVLRSSPLHVLYPETNSGAGSSGNVLVSGNMSNFQDHMRKELVKHRRDPGYVMTAPHPIGQQTIFGDAKNLHYFQEMKYQDEQLLNALGFPREFLTGGLQFSASSISLRILEVQFLKTCHLNNEFLSWVHQRVSTNYAVGDKSPKMRKFKMADDLQMLQLRLAESDKGNLAKSIVLEDAFDIDWKEEQEIIAKEDQIKSPTLMKRALMDVQVQVKSQEIIVESQAKASAKAQVAAAKEQADLERRDPDYAKIKVRQNMAQQEQMMMSAQQNMQQNMELKQQQQDRLAIKDGIKPGSGEQSENVSREAKELNSIISEITKGNSDPIPILDMVLQRSPSLYPAVVFSLFRSLNSLPPNFANSLYEHVSLHRPDVLAQLVGGNE